MRLFLCSVASVALLFTPVVASAQATSEATIAQSAPADEYFGQAGESVLGIRNRLDAMDNKSDSQMLSQGTPIELDNLQDCILDWQQKYPADPWVTTMMSRLISDYARAGQSSSPRALAMLRVMLDVYPNDPRTRDAVAAIGNEASADGNAILESVASDSDLPAVPSAPVPDVTIAVAPDDESAQGDDLLASPAWQAFGSSRESTGDPVDDATADVTTDAPDEATVAGAVIDASTGAPIAGAIVFVAPDRDSLDVTSTPYATTGNDGAFTVAHVPMGSAYSVGSVSLAHAEYVVVQPPRGSGYAAYHGMVDASDGNGNAGVIRLSAAP